MYADELEATNIVYRTIMLLYRHIQMQTYSCFTPQQQEWNFITIEIEGLKIQ